MWVTCAKKFVKGLPNLTNTNIRINDGDYVKIYDKLREIFADLRDEKRAETS